MSAKKLTQAVFDGLPKEYRWAAVDADGEGSAYALDPFCVPAKKYGMWDYPANSDVCHVSLGSGYDTTDWKNSKIERQDVPTAADIDWSQQDVPAGATHYSPETDATRALFYKDDFTKMWVVVWPSLGWQNALPVGEHERVIEIPTKPEPKVDWSAAPEGATHYTEKYCQYYKRVGHVVMLWDVDAWVKLVAFTTTDLDNMGAIPRPEPITDTRRDPVLEMARIEERACMPFPDGDPRYFETSDCYESLAVKICAEQPAAQVIDPPVLGNQSGRTYPHYFKDVSAVDAIDLYHVARLYDITDPALFHAFKKIACAGKRGAKDQAQDVQEAIDALKRWQELSV